MRLTSRTSYGLRALFDLAFHGAGRAVQAHEIAERQGVPLRYLEQILQDLRRAGIVEAKRGPRGGYALARGLGQVRLADVLTALDGAPEALFALDEPEGKGRRREGAAPDVPALVWGELAARAAEVFAAVTLGDLVARAEALGLERAASAPQMYFI